MAVELRNVLTRSLGSSLPATLLFDYPSLDALAAYLLIALDLVPAAEPTGVPATATSPAAGDDLAALSDEEAEALLLAELGGAGEGPMSVQDDRAVAAQAGDRRDPRAEGAAWPSPSVASREPIAVVGMGLRFPGGADDPESVLAAALGRRRRHRRGAAGAVEHRRALRPRPRRARQDGHPLGRLPARRRRSSTRRSSASRRARPRAWTRSSGCCWRSPGRPSSTPASPPIDSFGASAGVFVGIGNSDYLRLLLADREEIDTYTTTGSVSSVAAGRLSYLLGAQGPARVRRHRLLVVAGGGAPRRPEPARRRVRPGPGRRRRT